MASKKILILASTIQNMAVLCDENIEAELEAQGIIMETVSKLAKIGALAKEIKPHNFNPEPEEAKDPTGDAFCNEVRRRIEATYTEAGLSPLPAKAESMLCTNEVIREEYDKLKDDSPADTMINMKGVERIKDKIADGKFSPVITTKALMSAIISALKVEEHTWESTVFHIEVVESEVEGCCNGEDCDHDEDCDCGHKNEGLASAEESASLAEGTGLTIPDEEPAAAEPTINQALNVIADMADVAAVNPISNPLLGVVEDLLEDTKEEIPDTNPDKAGVVAKLEQALSDQLNRTVLRSPRKEVTLPDGSVARFRQVPSSPTVNETNTEYEVDQILAEAVEESPTPVPIPDQVPVPVSNIDEQVCCKAITRHIRCNPGQISQILGIEYDPDVEFPAEEEVNWHRKEGILFTCQGVEGIVCKVSDNGTAITTIVLEKV